MFSKKCDMNQLQVKVYVTVLACSLNNFRPLSSPWVPLWVMWGHYSYTVPSLGQQRWQHWSGWFPVFCDLFCLVLTVLANLFSGVFWVSSLSRWVNVILMWMFIYGVMEDCFEIESRKSPSFFFNYHYFKTITLHGLWPATESPETPEELTPSNVK